jgi:hypothetical protein
MLVAALKAQKSAELPAAQRELGLTLMKVERPTEAAPLLAESYASYAAAKDDLAKMVWLEWVESLLAADEPSVAKVAGDQTDEEAFAKALSMIDARLEALKKKGDAD